MKKQTLKIIVGDITNDDILSLCNAVVLPTNPMMIAGAGVSGAIFKKAGVNELEEYTSRTFGISYYNPIGKNEMKVKEIRVTPGFNLGKDIIFAQGPKKWEYKDFNLAINDLLETYTNIVLTAKTKGYSSILTPSLGTGDYGFSHEEVARPVIAHLTKLANENDIRIYLVLYTSDLKEIYVD